MDELGTPWRRTYFLTAAAERLVVSDSFFKTAANSSGVHLGFSSQGRCPHGKVRRKKLITASVDLRILSVITSSGGLVSAGRRAHSMTIDASFVVQFFMSSSLIAQTPPESRTLGPYLW